MKVVHRHQPPPHGLVCKPVSDAHTGHGQQFVKTAYTFPQGTVTGEYPQGTGGNVYADVVNGVYVKREADGLQGGNCYWKRGDGLVLSWFGPFGFPFTTAIVKMPSPSSVNLGGYDIAEFNETLSISVDYIDNATSSVQQNTASYDFYSRQRFRSFLYARGKGYPTPSEVLGAGMRESTLIVVCKTDRTTDTVYYKKLSDPDWTSAGTIGMPETATLRFCHRNAAYMLSPAGDKLISLIPAVDTTDTADLPVKTVIVRCDILYSNATVSLGTPTFETVKNGFTYDHTYSYTYSREDYDVVFDGHTYPGFTENRTQTQQGTNFVGRVVQAVGFTSAGLESILEIVSDTINFNSSYTWSRSYAFPVGNIDEYSMNGSRSRGFSFKTLQSGVLIASNSFSSSSNEIYSSNYSYFNFSVDISISQTYDESLVNIAFVDLYSGSRVELLQDRSESISRSALGSSRGNISFSGTRTTIVNSSIRRSPENIEDIIHANDQHSTSLPDFDTTPHLNSTHNISLTITRKQDFKYGSYYDGSIDAVSVDNMIFGQINFLHFNSASSSGTFVKTPIVPSSINFQTVFDVTTGTDFSLTGDWNAANSTLFMI